MGSSDEEHLHCVKVAHEVMDDKPVSVASIALVLLRERAAARAERDSTVRTLLDEVAKGEESSTAYRGQGFYCVYSKCHENGHGPDCFVSRARAALGKEQG